ncbi:ABC transporter substrate-binding protein [Geobacter sp. OR-1]|uniref:substrate-binding periplasmic protein n=1 Tax=Geobacter sp. OR-1 TaxID=1266765 RepID=UPI0005A86231|nr:transporter substrate-binding domain-containing protein [Geobacter sp. OR-1]
MRAGVYDNPPLTIISDTGELSGIHVDLLKNIAVKEKWDVTFVPGSITQGIERLKAGEVDILLPLAYSADRVKYLDFNNVTVIVNWGQVYTPKTKAMQSFLDLEGKRVAVVRNNVQYSALKDMMEQFWIKPVYVEVDGFDKVFDLLRHNQVDAGIVGRFYGMANEAKFDVAASPIVFNPIEVRYGFPKGSGSDLIQAIDSQLTAMKGMPNSPYHQALEKYLQISNKKRNAGLDKMGHCHDCSGLRNFCSSKCVPET